MINGPAAGIFAPGAFAFLLSSSVGTARGRWYFFYKQEGNGSASWRYIGGDAMTALEVIGLLNLLAVVIFGVINATKK